MSAFELLDDLQRDERKRIELLRSVNGALALFARKLTRENPPGAMDPNAKGPINTDFAFGWMGQTLVDVKRYLEELP